MWRLVGAAVLIGGLALLGVYRWQRHNYRRFQEVRPGVLYRMGIPSEEGFGQIVRQYGIRTVVCLHEGAVPRVKAGWFFDLGEASGPAESQLAQQLGVRFLHWPIGDQGAWPWPPPEYLEEFFHLMDEPGHWPVLIHCWAGKHRTGTLAALFRLEYDGWPVERALAEMYAFQFGTPACLQEHNLRTYVRRPRPSAKQWQSLQEAFSLWSDRAPADYEELIRRVQAESANPAIAARLEEYLRQGRPFGVCLADRLLRGPAEPWLPAALQQAEKIVFSTQTDSPNDGRGSPEELASAAGILADHAPRHVQARLWLALKEEMQRPGPTPRYQALVAGLTNRYRPTRLPYLKLLLEDHRPRPEPEAAGACYADTAVARTAAIVQVDFMGRRGRVGRQEWDQAIQRAKQWFADHPEAIAVWPED